MTWIEQIKDVVPLRRRLRKDEDFAPLRNIQRFRDIVDRGDQ